MVPERSVTAARAQLAALAASPPARRPSTWQALARVPLAPDARAAAVLVLFGVLDGMPSDHDAQARAVSRDLDVLLLARSATLRSHPGQIAFPGGRLDPNDDGPVAAALREAEEETGLDPAGVEVLGTLEPIPVIVSGHLVTPVLGWWRRPSPVRVVDVAESVDVFRAPVADLLDRAHRGITVITRDGVEYRGPAFEVARPGGESHVVWGFTATVLDGVFDLLGWTEPWDHAREIPLPLNGVDDTGT